MAREITELMQNPVNKIKVQDQIVYHGSSQKELAANRILMKTLALNGEQLTYFLEDLILDNPFIEMEYPPLPKLGHRHEDEDHHHAHEEIGKQVLEGNQSLTNYLFEQISLHRETEIRNTMMRLVDELDDRGYLPYTYQDLAAKMGLAEMEVLDAMTLLKQLEPAGVGAYDLRECLMLQTEQDSMAPDMAYYLLEVYSNELSEKDYQAILDCEELSKDELVTCVNYYHSLNAVPADLFEKETDQHLTADVKILHEADALFVQLNQQAGPKLIFNQSYFYEMMSQDDPALLDYCLGHQKSYQAIEQALMTRETLMLAVAYQVAYFQGEYFKGNLADKAPLSIRMVARQLQIPESIVSQVVNNKYLMQDDQVYPMTDYFNMANRVGRSRLNASSIKKMVVNLMKEHPDLTDSQIAAKLEEQKVIVSAGMVHNFRQSLD